MTEHPAAPTTEDETWIDLTIAMRAYMQDRNEWDAVEDAMRARDDFHRAEARAAARKEVGQRLRDHQPFARGYQAFDEFSLTCSCEKWSNDGKDGDDPNASWLKHFLDSLSTDTREEPNP